MSEEQDYKCRRCNGCGQVAGSGRAEQPWNTFVDVPPHQALEKIMGMHESRPCPDCGGRGNAKPANRSSLSSLPAGA